MKFFNYIHYFFYLGINWNWRLAFTTIMQEIRGELKYGIDSSGFDELKKLKKDGVDISHATIYMPASYLLLEKVFDQLPAGTRSHFLDIGCGKGRAICVAAFFGFHKITGIDFYPELCQKALDNIRVIQSKNKAANFEIINTDAINYTIPADADCIFLFNPFDDTVLKKVLGNILDSHKKHKRQVCVIYLNPIYKQLFTDTGFREIWHYKKQQYFEGSLLLLG
ncbi:MAG: class I SAM-dependent methyltransferase [Ferruginibacter sp.]